MSIQQRRSSTHRSAHRNGLQRGFTLIELLVVIAIIAILAAILFPVFARARENARRASCQSNLKQIGLGIMQYSQDYDEMLPFSFYGVDGGGSSPDGVRYKWMDTAYPYIKSEQVFTCPSDSSTSSKYIYYKNLPAQSATNYGSYAINAMYRYDDSGNRTPPVGTYLVGLKIAALSDASGTIWITDAASGSGVIQTGWSCTPSGTGGCTSRQPANVIDTTVTPNKIDSTVARHLDTTNVLFTDGHVKALNLGAIARRRASDGVTLAAYTIQSDD